MPIFVKEVAPLNVRGTLVAVTVAAALIWIEVGPRIAEMNELAGMPAPVMSDPTVNRPVEGRPVMIAEPLVVALPEDGAAVRVSVVGVHPPGPGVAGNAPVVGGGAANGASVVVVFEDPNAMTPRIGIVLSHTTGHIFEARSDATPEDVPAVGPWVTLDHRKSTVWWNPGENVEIGRAHA